eukprot:6489984-Amphidinium_carterae.1
MFLSLTLDTVGTHGIMNTLAQSLQHGSCEETHVHGICSCCRRTTALIESMDVDALTPQEHLMHVLVSYHASRTCSVLANALVSTLAAAAAVIDNRRAIWGDSDWAKSADAVLQGPKKRRRVEEEVKETPAQSSMPTHGLAVRALNIKQQT